MTSKGEPNLNSLLKHSVSEIKSPKKIFKKKLTILLYRMWVGRLFGYPIICAQALKKLVCRDIGPHPQAHRMICLLPIQQDEI